MLGGSCVALTRKGSSLKQPRNNPRRRQWHPTPVLLPGKSHGRRSLVGCSPWGRWESDTTEWLHFHFSLSCIGEGNGNPLLCSCLENPRDGGTWWAAIYGVAQSRTQLKWHSNSSSSSFGTYFSVASFSVTLCVGFCVLDRTVTSPTLEGVILFRKWILLFSLPRWLSLVIVQVGYFVLSGWWWFSHVSHVQLLKFHGL